MTAMWIRCIDQLPADGERVLAWLPSNTVYLPGKTGATELRNAVILRFHHDFFVKNPSKTGKPTSPHFWIGEGTGNHFFEDVSHWMAMPTPP